MIFEVILYVASFLENPISILMTCRELYFMRSLSILFPITDGCLPQSMASNYEYFKRKKRMTTHCFDCGKVLVPGTWFIMMLCSCLGFYPKFHVSCFTRLTSSTNKIIGTTICPVCQEKTMYFGMHYNPTSCRTFKGRLERRSAICAC